MSAHADVCGGPHPAAHTLPDNHVLELISQNTRACLKPQQALPGLEPEAFIAAGNPVLQVPNQQPNQKGRREEEGRQHRGTPPTRCYWCGVGSCNVGLY